MVDNKSFIEILYPLSSFQNNFYKEKFILMLLTTKKHGFLPVSDSGASFIFCAENRFCSSRVRNFKNHFQLLRHHKAILTSRWWSVVSSFMFEHAVLLVEFTPTHKVVLCILVTFFKAKYKQLKSERFQLSTLYSLILSKQTILRFKNFLKSSFGNTAMSKMTAHPSPVEIERLKNLMQN